MLENCTYGLMRGRRLKPLLYSVEDINKEMRPGEDMLSAPDSFVGIRVVLTDKINLRIREMVH